MEDSGSIPGGCHESILYPNIPEIAKQSFANTAFYL